MRRLPEMENIWRNYEHVGKYRPIIRATITRPQMKLFSYALKGIDFGTETISTPTGTVSKVPSITIQKTNTALYEKYLKDPTSVFEGIDVTEVYATHWVHDEFQPKELPNIKSCSWNRSIDQDAADMSLTMLNVQQVPDGTDLGTARGYGRDGTGGTGGDSVYDMDQLGYFSPSRGKTTDSRFWGHTSNEWTGLLMPDNLIRTYQGYGVDWTVEPEKDPNLAQTGVWLIDDVTFTAAGNIEIKCRDLGRLLLEQGFEAPVLPNDFNPVGFKAWNTEDLTRTVTIEETVTKVIQEAVEVREPATSQRTRQPLTNVHSSTEAWVVGTNGDGGPGKIKDPNNYQGRGPGLTLDDNGATFWISVGNSSPRAPYAYEWVQYDLPGGTINEVMVDPIKSGYQAYVSVMQDGQWVGASTINYREAGIGRNGSNIKFVAQATVNQGRNTISFPPVDRAQKLRVTLGNLQDWSANFSGFKFRAAIASVEAYATSTHQGSVKTEYRDKTVSETQSDKQTVVLKPGAVGENPGGGTARYSDYTDIVKLICAWGGFYWPQDITEATSNSTVRSGTRTPTGPFGDFVVEGSLPTFRKYHFDTPDTDVLGHVPGRVWGDFMTTGQSGPAEISQDNFMAKSLREGINVIADTVSFNFWIDETGAVQWRYPNIDTIGNWVTDNSAGAARVAYVHDLDEKQLLTDFTTTLSSRRVAEIVILKSLAPIKNATEDQTGGVGYVSSGYNPNPTGLRRSVIWTDAENLASNEEAKIMGDLIATRMLFNYRSNTVVVPGYAGLQIDDQIKIHERTSSDSFYHLITAISSEHDNESGEWNMTLNTMWLGDTPEGRWTIPRRTRQTREDNGTAQQPVDSRGGRTLL